MRPHFGEQQLRVGQRITGVLDPHLVAGREQHTNRDVDCLLSTTRDDDLLGVAAHRARRPQIFTDVPAQFGEAGRIRVTEVVRSQPAHGAIRQAAPRLGGEFAKYQESNTELTIQATAANKLPTVSHCQRGSFRLGP
jgi:hypothetical protein